MDVSPSTEALMVASGVRRSCETAASSAVRVASACAEDACLLRLFPEPLLLQHDPDLRGEGLEHAAVARGQHATGQGEHPLIVDDEDHLGGLRVEGGVGAVRRQDVPPATRSSRAARPPRA